jgi:hypothetical protein
MEVTLAFQLVSLEEFAINVFYVVGIDFQRLYVGKLIFFKYTNVLN